MESTEQKFVYDPSKYDENTSPDFLVIGTAKSAGTWIAGLLHSHPEIDCIPPLPRGQAGMDEGHIFDTLYRIDEDGGIRTGEIMTRSHKGFFADLVPYMHRVSRFKFYDMIKKRYNAHCNRWRTSGKKMLGEKTGEYVWCLSIIDYFYPGIKKICILRDPKDRIVSWHFSQVRKNRIPNSPKVSEILIQSFCKRIKLEYESLLNYNGNIHVLTYEDMTNDPYKETKKMLDYLGANSSDEIVNKVVEEGSFKNRTKLNKAENDKIRERGEESINSQFRKGIVGDWKNYLTKDQIKYIRKELRRLQNKVNKKFGIDIKV